MVTIFLSTYGKQGLRELALQNLAKSHYAAERFCERGARLRFSGPFFNEMVVSGVRGRADVARRLRAHKIVAGLELGSFFPELDGDALVCVTETVSREKIDELVDIYTGS
jgi:glycine dehydrogenase subunit 1